MLPFGQTRWWKWDVHNINTLQTRCEVGREEWEVIRLLSSHYLLNQHDVNDPSLCRYNVQYNHIVTDLVHQFSAITEPGPFQRLDLMAIYCNSGSNQRWNSVRTRAGCNQLKKSLTMAEQIEVGAVGTDREFGRKARYAPFLSYSLWLMSNRIVDPLHKLKKQAHKRHARLLLVSMPKSLQLRKNWN